MALISLVVVCEVSWGSGEFMSSQESGLDSAFSMVWAVASRTLCAVAMRGEVFGLLFVGVVDIFVV